MPTMIRGTPDDYENMRASEVFARRLRDTRKARGLTQEELADMLTRAGIPMSKTAVVGIERAKRGVSLDEFLAITAVLNAVPAHMLTPPEGVFVKITDDSGTDALGFRDFLRYGFPWNLDAVPYEYLPDEEREKFQLRIARLALNVSDAYRGGDNPSVVDAVLKIVDEVVLRESELARDRGRGGVTNG